MQETTTILLQWCIAFLFAWIPYITSYIYAIRFQSELIATVFGLISAIVFSLGTFYLNLATYLAPMGPMPKFIPLTLLCSMALYLFIQRMRVKNLFDVIGTAFLLGLISLLTGLMRGIADQNLGVQHTLAVRYWVSVDNKIPGFFARAIQSDLPMKPYLFADWKASDRPPLASGWLCISRTLLNSKYGETSLLIAGATLLVPLICVILATFKTSRKHWMPVAVIMFSTPFVFTNTVFTWPKIIAGLLFLLAISIFFIDQFPYKYWIIGLTTALSFLAHGSTMFMFPGLIYVAVTQRINLLNYLKILCAAFVCCAPWILFQQIWDKSANRLIYWHIAGQSQGSDGEGILSTIIKNYSELEFAEIIKNKLENVYNLLIVGDTNPAIEGLRGFPGLINAWASETIVGSLWPLIVCVLLCFLLTRNTEFRAPRGYLSAVLIGMFTFVLLEFGARPDSIASAHIAPLSIAIFFGVVFAEYVVVTTENLLHSNWTLSGLMLIFLTWNFVNYGVLSGVNAAEGGNGGSLSYSLAVVWLVASLGLCGMTTYTCKRNDHGRASSGVLV